MAKDTNRIHIPTSRKFLRTLRSEDSLPTFPGGLSVLASPPTIFNISSFKYESNRIRHIFCWGNAPVLGQGLGGLIPWQFTKVLRCLVEASAWRRAFDLKGPHARVVFGDCFAVFHAVGFVVLFSLMFRCRSWLMLISCRLLGRAKKLLGLAMLAQIHEQAGRWKVFQHQPVAIGCFEHV